MFVLLDDIVHYDYLLQMQLRDFWCSLRHFIYCLLAFIDLLISSVNFSCSHGSLKNLLNPLLGLQIGFAQAELSTSLVGNVPRWVDAQHNSPALVVQVLTFIPPSTPISNILVFMFAFGLGMAQFICFFKQFLIWSHLPAFPVLDKQLWLFKSSPSTFLCLYISA